MSDPEFGFLRRNWLLWVLLGLFAGALAVVASFSRAERIGVTQTVCVVVLRELDRRVREEYAAGKRVGAADVQRFAAELSRPNNRAGLIYADAQRRPLDRWGNLLTITTEVGEEWVRIEVRSAGVDEEPGTEDDLKREAVIALQAEKND